MIKKNGSVWSITAIIACLLLLSCCKAVQQASAPSVKPVVSKGTLESETTSRNVAETKGRVIEGYTLQNNDRVYFNAIRNYVQGKFDTAFVTLNYYNKLDSTNAAAYYYLASLKGRANFLKPTLTDASRAARLAPDNKWIQAFYANVLAFDESYDKSAQIFSRLAAKNPADRAQYYIAASKMYSRSKNYEAALKVLDTLQQTRPEHDEDILMEKQNIYMTSKDLPNAIKVTQELADAYPLSPEYLIQLNEIYEIQGNTEKSLATMKLLQDRFPYNDDITSYTFGYYLKKRNMEMVTESLNEYVDAAEKNQEKDLSILSQIGSYISNNPKDTAALTFIAGLTEKITVQKPGNFTAKRLLASLNLFSRKAELGLQQSEALIKDRPHNYALWTPVLSYYLYYTDDQNATLKFLDRMEAAFPDSIDVPMNKMFIYRGQSKLDTALHYAFKGLDLAQKQKAKEREVVFYNSIAEAYNEQKQYQKSDSVFEDLLKKAPNDIFALNNYAYYLSERGERLEYALNLSKRTLEQEYNQPNYLDTYGWILYKMKRYDEAKVYIEKAISYAGNDVSAVVLEHYADIEFQLGNTENALKIWKAIDAAGQGSPLLKKKIKDKKLYE